MGNAFDINVDLLVTSANGYDLIFGRNLQKTIHMVIQEDKVTYENPFTKRQETI